MGASDHFIQLVSRNVAVGPHLNLIAISEQTEGVRRSSLVSCIADRMFDVLGEPLEVMRLNYNTNVTIKKPWGESESSMIDNAYPDEVVFIYFKGTANYDAHRSSISFLSNMKFFGMTLSFEDRATRNLKEYDLLDLSIQIEKLLQGEKFRSYIAFGEELSVSEGEELLYPSINKLLAERRAAWVLISPALWKTERSLLQLGNYVVSSQLGIPLLRRRLVAVAT
jgi:hypothetical protein